MRSARPTWTAWLAAAAILGTVALGIAVRAQEPLADRVVPAEDPYTHMMLIRGHLADGSLDPPHEGAILYPPGMHAIMSSVWVYTGASLHDLFLFAPVVLGGLSVLGVALLLWRHAGTVAAVVGGLAMALAPEEIFRTTMMSPTAVDLAILPFFLLSILETMRGRVGWAVPVAAMATYFIVAHPWVLAVATPVALGIAILWLIFARDLAPRGPGQALGAAAVLGVLGAALAVAVNACYSQCGLGFDDLRISGGATGLDMVGNIGAGLAVAAAAIIYVFRRTVHGVHHRSGTTPRTVRLLLSGVAAVALVAVTMPAVQQGFPEHVELMRMFGWPILGLATIGLILGPLLPTRAAIAGAALVTVTYPFVIHNPLDSEFWPHRTAAYFGLGAALLAGTGAQLLYVAARRAAAWLDRKNPQAAPANRGRAAMLAALPIGVTLLAAGSVYAATPLEYETGWYKLYPPCENDTLRALGEEVDGDTVLVTGAWQPKLVAAAYSNTPQDVWFSSDFFNDPAYREDTMIGLSLDGRDIVVVVDRHMKLEHPDTDTSFLRSGGWSEEAVCTGQGISGARMLVYRQEGSL